LAVAVADDVLAGHKVLAFIARFGFGGFDFARHEPFLPSLSFASNLLDKGWNVAIAPEGHISKTGKLLPFKSGIGLLAVETGAPVIPVKTIGLFGTVPLHENWPVKRSRVVVRIGEPIYFSSHDTYDEATKLLEKTIQAL
jgi:long-chain acyl-CoA synthetase